MTEADYRGDIVMLYFGYTFCPDVCPTTLANVADVLKRLGPDAERVRLLFVTVDPDRDTLPVLADYVKSFAPQIEGLRGDPDQIASLARRYRIAYSVTPATATHPYEVTHGSAIYVFDGSGAARLLIPSLGSAAGDVAGVTIDIRRLVNAGQSVRPVQLAHGVRLSARLLQFYLSATHRARFRATARARIRASAIKAMIGSDHRVLALLAGRAAHGKARRERTAVLKAQGDGNRASRRRGGGRRHAHEVVSAGREFDFAVRGHGNAVDHLHPLLAVVVDAAMDHEGAASGRGGADKCARPSGRVRQDEISGRRARRDDEAQPRLAYCEPRLLRPRRRI